MREDEKTLKRACEIFGAHRAGETYRAIGKRLGISGQTAARIDRQFKDYALRASEWLSPQKDVLDNILAASVDRLPNLSVRTRNGLYNSDIKTVRQLTDMEEQEVIALPNMGRKSVDELQAVLARFGLVIPKKWSRQTVAGLKRRSEARKTARLIVSEWCAGVVAEGVCIANVVDELFMRLSRSGVEFKKRT